MDIDNLKAIALENDIKDRVVVAILDRLTAAESENDRLKICEEFEQEYARDLRESWAILKSAGIFPNGKIRVPEAIAELAKDCNQLRAKLSELENAAKGYVLCGYFRLDTFTDNTIYQDKAGDTNFEPVYMRPLVGQTTPAESVTNIPEGWSLVHKTEDTMLFSKSPKVDQPAPVQGELEVWYGSMPESNGKTNWTAILYRKGEGFLGGIGDGFTIDRSEYPDRVRYEADRVRHLIGEIKERPFILDYDSELHSDYQEPKVEQVSGSDEPYLWQWISNAHNDSGVYFDESSAEEGQLRGEIIIPLYTKRPSPNKADVPPVRKVTDYGQINEDDLIILDFCGKRICVTANQVLQKGTTEEEIVYNRKKNFYFITSMILDGTSNHKNVYVVESLPPLKDE